MEAFVEFLNKAKRALKDVKSYKCIQIVTGNESCDLDSTTSTLVLAYLMHLKNVQKKLSSHLVVPVMNVDAKYFPLRTETCYLLKRCNIELNQLILKDQINYSTILKDNHVETILVDHHVLCKNDKVLESTVLQIFDHRPINSEEICKNENLKKTIKTVGSCSTLIAQEIINSGISLFDQLYYLLYATIIFDTIGLDTECGRTFDEDIAVAQYLENVLRPTQTRKEQFEILWKVHNDTSNLGTKELLYRDLKVVQGIPIPGLPMLVEDYLKREDALTAISTFAYEYPHKNVVLIGIDASQEVKRDIAIFYTDLGFKNTLISLLKNSKDMAGSDLLLTELPQTNNNIINFRQGNIKLTRKFILPLVTEAARRFFKD